MREEKPVVYVIDDDESAREAVADLLRSVGHSVHSFASAQEAAQLNAACRALARIARRKNHTFDRSWVSGRSKNVRSWIVTMAGQRKRPGIV